jgi:hypothetical protein
VQKFVASETDLTCTDNGRQILRRMREWPALLGEMRGAGHSALAPAHAPAPARRRLLRLPDPLGSTDSSRGRAGRSASPNLRQFQELALCCEDETNDSTNASELDRRSQASTVVPLESVDTFVQSASELAVEALKLGRTAEAQRIIRLADNLYEQSGVSGASAAVARRPCTSRLGVAAPKRAERPPSKTRLASTFRELAMLVSDGEDCPAPSRPMSLADQYQSDWYSSRSQRPAHDTSLWNSDPFDKVSGEVADLEEKLSTLKREVSYSSSMAPWSASAAAARHPMQGLAWEATPHVSEYNSGARKSLAPLDPQTAPQVVNVYGTAYFGSGPGGAGTPLGTGQTTSRPGTAHGADALTEMTLKAQCILGMQGSRTSTERMRSTERMTTLVKHAEECRDFQQTIPPKDAAAAAPATLASQATGEQAWGKHAHDVKRVPQAAADTKVNLAPCEMELKPSAPVDVAVGNGELKAPVLVEAWLVGADAERQRRGEMSMQSLEDTWGLKKLIKMAAIRRESASSSPEHDINAEMDSFVRASLAEHASRELSVRRMCALDQSGDANPNYNPRPESVDLGTLPTFPAQSNGRMDSMSHVSGDGASYFGTNAHDAHEESMDYLTTCHLQHKGQTSPVVCTSLDASTYLDSSCAEDADEALSLEDHSITERSSPTHSSNFSHLSQERAYADTRFVDTSYQHQRLVDTFNQRRQRFCITIQRAMRMSWARRRLQEVRDQAWSADEQRLHSAALTIQQMFFAVQQRALDRQVRAAASRRLDPREKAGMILTGFARLVLACKAVRHAERQRGLGQFFAGLAASQRLAAGIFGDAKDASAGSHAAATTADTRAAPCIQIQKNFENWVHVSGAAAPCIQIQCCVRSWLAKREVRPNLHQRRVYRAATTLQRSFRVHVAQKEYCDHKYAKVLERRVRTLQAAWRLHSARERFKGALWARRGGEAACTIQRACRARAARNALRVLRELPLRKAREAALLLEQQDAAARRIQQVTRGHAARRHVSHLRDVLRRDELEFCQHLVACRRRIAHAITGAGDGSGVTGLEVDDSPAMASSSELRRAIFSSAEDALAKARLSVAAVSLDDSMSRCHESADAAICAGGGGGGGGGFCATAMATFDLSLSPVLSPVLESAAETFLPQHLPALPTIIRDLLKPMECLVNQSLHREGSRAAATLQAVWRGHAARHLARRRLSVLAVVRLQRVYRGHQGRIESKRVALLTAAAASRRPQTAFQDLRAKAATVCVQRTRTVRDSGIGLSSGYDTGLRDCSDACAASDAPMKSWAAALSVRNARDGVWDGDVPGSLLEDDGLLLGCASSVGSPAKSSERRVFGSSSEALLRVRP